MGSFITLTTDFGLNDSYVAAMKGVIYSINPEATIVDISNNIRPQNILEAAFVLGTAFKFFPLYSVHVVVVDPGVGTDRRAIILKTPRAYFVAPDNGVLSCILEAYPHQAVPDSQRVKPGPDLKAYAITKSEYWIQPVSPTFHGRDIFAPVAARLSLGMTAASLGENIDTVTSLPLPRPSLQEGQIIGHILHVDNFGNLITDVKAENLSGKEQSVTIVISGSVIRGLARTYATGPGPRAIFGSSGYLEIALANGSAAAFFPVKIGDEIIIKY
jgi:hypothetical protein